MPNKSQISETLSDRRFARTQMLSHVFSNLQYGYAPRKIVWATDKDGNEVNPSFLWDKYYGLDVEIVRKEFMKDMDHFVDRHKIIALTQRTILEVQPLAFGGQEDTCADDVYVLNADYAFLFGIQYLCRCNEVFYPVRYFENPSNAFPTEKFTFPFYRTNRGLAFIREHKKLLYAKSLAPIPLFWASHMWFLFEQWGLEYMRHQPDSPREKSDGGAL